MLYNRWFLLANDSYMYAGVLEHGIDSTLVQWT